MLWVQYCCPVASVNTAFFDFHWLMGRRVDFKTYAACRSLIVPLFN